MSYNFQEKEKDILKFWHDHGIFQKSLDWREKSKKFVFFEGPPTANGRPGIHHFLGRAFKDLFCRYKTMRGFFVLRKSGWDTHGLPVEIEVEKKLGFKTKRDIENYGIDKFNKKAKESVWQYKAEWEEMTKRMGFWLDLKNPYITYQNDYIESLWHIIKTIWDKKLLYLAHKVVPFCTRCGTSLSSHEVAQGYRMTKDKSVIVKFQVTNWSNLTNMTHRTYILVWTTTPWTLTGNVALAVGKDIEYVIVKKDDESYILAKDLVEKVFSEPKAYHLEPLIYKGSNLINLEYEPLFDIPELKSEYSYKVYEADFVSTKEGTGIVHTAVMYGEDDYNLGAKVGLPKHHIVDEQGKFTGVSKEFDGKYIKDPKTEELLIQKLNADGRLLKADLYEHDYPFCWRCDTPLVYYAKNSWFIKMSAVKDQLLKNNQKINWYPEHFKEGRFGQWLKEGKDWAISRERYWGTPLPIWQCQMGKSQTNSKSLASPKLSACLTEDEESRQMEPGQNPDSKQECGNIQVIGSIAELEKNAISRSKNKYFILRHGYTIRDEKRKMIINAEISADKYHLTSEGIKQIEKSVELIKNNYEIDLIYSSPFLRTMETADIAAKLLHLNVHKDDRLAEIKHGGCEGNPHSSCPVKDTRHTMDDKYHELGESWNEVRLRVMNFMQDLESKYSGKNVLIVSHGDPLWLLNFIALGASGSQIIELVNEGRSYYLEPGSFHELNWKNIPRNNYGELDLHRPQIDNVCLKCEDCGAVMKKVPDLVDVWFDSGAMPYAQWHWPFDNKKTLEEQFPADFISEAIDQTRGWFYTLLAVSTLLGKGNPYKNVICYGHVLDKKGKKMSKSKGNIISPFEVMNKVGADTARWYFYTINQPGEYKSFSMKDLESKLQGFVFTLQNCLRFYELYVGDVKIFTYTSKAANLLDQWILSKFNGLLKEVSDALDKYDPTSAARAIEKFVVEDLSNWWLRRSRKRKEALSLLRFLLLELSKVLAPFVPFIAEDIYRRIGRPIGPISIHLHDWPMADKKLIDSKLETEMDEIRNIVTAGLAIRKEKSLKVRQPLAKLTLGKTQNSKLQTKSELLNLIKEELNVKEVVFDNNQKNDLVLDFKLSTALVNEGYSRELIRQIQDMRKEAKYKLDEKIFCEWHSDDESLSSAIQEWSDEISKEVLLEKFTNIGHDQKRAYDVKKEFELAPQRKIWIGVRK